MGRAKAATNRVLHVQSRAQARQLDDRRDVAPPCRVVERGVIMLGAIHARERPCQDESEAGGRYEQART